MDIQFWGATECVTGSNHLVRANGKNILLDCGLFQGKDEKKMDNIDFKFSPKDIDYVILSHAHIDHSGKIPLLYKLGFEGKIICTEATMELCNVMLPDSGHIQEMEAEWENKKRKRKGLDVVEPLYTVEDAELSMNLFKGYPYNKMIELFDGFNVCFRDAGHLLGSAIVELYVKEKNKEEVKIVFTGDLGNINVPIVSDPTYIESADYLIMETTYGDRIHNMDNQLKDLADIVNDTFERGGNVIIPSFAVGRTQEILYALNRYIKSERLKDITVYVDSPLAAESTKIFNKCRSYYDDEAKKLLKQGVNPLNFEGLVFTKSPEESMKINKIQSGALVISASGMCDAGRIKHHLKHNLWRKESSIVFVGYQAVGTLGRSILDGKKKVKLFGEEIVVNAEIHNLPGLSGHADRAGLLNWLENLEYKPKKVMLVHGDSKSQKSFKKLIDSKGYNSSIMKYGEIVTIGEEVEKVAIKESKVKRNIINLLDSIEDVDNVDKDVLIEKIKEVI